MHHTSNTRTGLGAGVPPQLRFVPGVIDAVKASVKGDVEQLMDKMHFVADKVGTRHRRGCSTRNGCVALCV
jgi:hypothetical protein